MDYESRYLDERKEALEKLQHYKRCLKQDVLEQIPNDELRQSMNESLQRRERLLEDLHTKYMNISNIEKHSDSDELYQQLIEILMRYNTSLDTNLRRFHELGLTDRFSHVYTSQNKITEETDINIKEELSSEFAENETKVFNPDN